jgi:hypothetical protein
MCVVALVGAVSWVTASGSVAQRLVYCEKPGSSGAFLAVSAGVSCKTAAAVARTLTSRACYLRNRCVVDGFRCVAYWEGRFDRLFEYTHHALCSNGWRWIEWDGS